MKVYAYPGRRWADLLVDDDLFVVNGERYLTQRSDGTLIDFDGAALVFMMDAPPGVYYNDILAEAQRILDDEDAAVGGQT